MDAKTLVSQFRKDPGLAFVRIIQTSPQPMRAQDIKQQVLGAGVNKMEVDRDWKRIQRVITLHPQITLEKRKYLWSAEQQPAQKSLDVLAGNLLAKLPTWVAQPLVRNVAESLLKVENGYPGWVDQEYEAAKLVAVLAVAVEVLQARGDSIKEVVELLTEETHRKRLWPLGRPGETLSFDPDLQEAEEQAPEPGTVVRVVRSGYLWRGGGEPIVAAKAIVAV